VSTSTVRHNHRNKQASYVIIIISQQQQQHHWDVNNVELALKAATEVV